MLSYMTTNARCAQKHPPATDQLRYTFYQLHHAYESACKFCWGSAELAAPVVFLASTYYTALVASRDPFVNWVGGQALAGS